MSRRRSSAEHTPHPREVLDADGVAQWQRLGVAVRALLSPAAFQQAFPPVVHAWAPTDRRRWLDIALALAPRSARAAIAVYRELPTALRGVAPDLRARLLAVLAHAAPHVEPEAMEAVAPLAGALVLDVPAGRRAAALDVVGAVAERCPTAVPGLLRVLARVVEAAGTRLSEWTRRGLDLAAREPAAARAYFALESRTSVHALDASPTATSALELDGILRRYIHMLSGAPAAIRPAAGFSVRPALEEAPEAGGVALATTIDVLDTWEENARLHRLLAAFVAGRREFGTYALPNLVPTLRATTAPAALEDCFLLAEGYRIATRLANHYPGIGADIAWAASTLLDRWRADRPGAALLLDALLLHALAPPDLQTPRWLVRAAALVRPCLDPLARPTATADDALGVAELLAAILLLPANPENAEPPLTLAAEFYMASDDEGWLGARGPEDGATGDGGGDRPLPLPEIIIPDLQLQLGELAERITAAGRPLTAEEIRALIDAGIVPDFGESDGVAAEAGLFVTQLLGKMLAKRSTAPPPGAASARRGRVQAPSGGAATFVYDEWDHVIDDYRAGWCALRELALGDDAGVFFTQTLARYATLVPEIRRHFQRVRPESWRTLRGLEDGEDFDLAAAVDARAELRAGRSPSPKLYTARARLEREVATLFLLDMSASTDEAAPVGGETRRIIDIEKAALVIMAAALEEIGDAYAIYGFSGQGRHNVEFYLVKAFGERLATGARGRIGGIEPRCSTRMGTALRHAIHKMRDVRAPNRHLLLLSDGFPQDLDYGDDRRSHAYGINDTAMALREVEAAGIKPFCITVDLAGHDYLRRMCDPQRYLIIENVADLPRELPKIYQRLVRAA
jgi:hypothetical protein